jgi:hypothetical protein
MNRSLEGLYSSLEPLRLYALRQNSFVDRELTSYGEGFGRIEDLLAETLDGAFVQTAGGDMLARHEQLAGFPPRPGLPDAARRELVLYRLGAAPFDFTPEGLKNSVLACGLAAELTERPADEAITLRVERVIDETLDFDRMKALVTAALPAHLDCLFDYGITTWDMIEDKFDDWDTWDSADFSWARFDLE